MNKYQAVDAEQARTKIEPILLSICTKAHSPVPILHIVEKLPSGSRYTAEATFRGGPGIRIPASLALSLSSDAVEHLLSHELGHIVLRRRSQWAASRKYLFGLFLVLGAALLTTWTVLIFSKGSAPPLSFILLGLLILFVADVLLNCHASRQHEIECDIFAARLQGHLNGARELMVNNDQTRRKNRRSGLAIRLLATHPTSERRLQIMHDAIRS